jgi:hypothetical protein
LLESATRRLERERKIKRARRIVGYQGQVSMLAEYADYASGTKTARHQV